MRILQILFIGIFYLFVFVSPIFAIEPPCATPPASPDPRIECVFGKIQAPSPLANFLAVDPTGAGAISNFLSRLVALFYTLGAIVLVFMFLWAAFEWMTSGGDKEKVASARNKIIYAIIGIVLFAVAFAVIRLLGTFTGFTFFAGQNREIGRDSSGNISYFICDGPNGSKIRFPGYALSSGQTPTAYCQEHGYQ